MTNTSTVAPRAAVKLTSLAVRATLGTHRHARHHHTGIDTHADIPPTTRSIGPVMDRDRISIRISSAEIASRIEELARDIHASMPHDTLMVPILTGSFIFAADLVRALAHAGADWPLDFMTLSSYGARTDSSGRIEVVRDLRQAVDGRTVLVIDDILDTGNTLLFARTLLRDRGAKDVRICALLDKPARRQVDLTADFTGFSVADEFLVGYGLDKAGRYRGLPYIGLVES
jgi:hypoxanthine phosphoribosyltransferase